MSLKLCYLNAQKTVKNSKNIFIISLLFTSLLPLYSEDYFYDGERKVNIKMQTDLLAEKESVGLGIDSNVNSGLIKKVDGNSKLIKSQGGIQVWKTNSISTFDSIKKSNKTKNIQDNYLPVYKDDKGNVLIPTGNIIVTFDIDLKESEIKSLLARKGLVSLEKLPLKSKNSWLVKTPAGSQSIEIANSLRGESGVLSSTPNFWMDFSKK